MTDAAPELCRRRHAYRPDLADQRLEGRVTATRFVAGTLMQVRGPAVPLRKAPDAKLGLENEVLLGETVTVFDEADGWAWCQLARDGYVGYLPAPALSAEIMPATHRVKAPGTFIYPQPDIKRPPLAHLSLNAILNVTAADQHFVTLATGGFVYARHVSPIDAYAREFVEVAESLIQTPYLWGGRTRVGLDCSGLVQLAMEAAGLTCPRDSDMAAAEVGEAVAVPADLDCLQRGDLVYWPGHCGIMIDSVMLLHANGHHMSTVIEPLSQAVRRIRKSGGGASASGTGIATIKRPTALGAAPA